MVALDCLAYTYYAWDDDENVVAAASSQPAPLTNPEISVDYLSLPDSSGWVQLLWRAPTPGRSTSTVLGGRQVGAYGVYSGAASAAVLGNFNCRTGSELFRSGFERGAPSAWTSSTP